jgi:hypothetical protein
MDIRHERAATSVVSYGSQGQPMIAELAVAEANSYDIPTSKRSR